MFMLQSPTVSVFPKFVYTILTSSLRIFDKLHYNQSRVISDYTFTFYITNDKKNNKL